MIRGTSLPDDLVKLSEVAKRLQTSASTLLRWSRNRDFPEVFHVGRGWLVRESEVARWLADRSGYRVEKMHEAMAQALRTHCP